MTTIIRWLLLIGMGLAPCAFSDEPPPLPASFSIKPQLYATGFEFAEGPAFDNAGNLYVVNYRGNGNIGRITPEGQASIWCDLAKLAPCEGRQPQANGLKVDSQGALIVADSGAGRLLRISNDGKQVDVLAERYEGSRFNAINDVAIGLNSIFFSDPGGSSEQKPVGSVYRYDWTSRLVSRVATGLAFPNGLAVSPDRKHLCVAESRRFRIMIYDVAADGTVGHERVLINFPEADSSGVRGGPYDPDGMIFDEHGRLFVAMWIGGIINVVEVPSGKLLRQYDAGGLKATNCHFHDDSLFVTVAAHEAVYRLKLGVRGFDYRPQ
jgi:sugar lactone lactonase YvrE